MAIEIPEDEFKAFIAIDTLVDGIAAGGLRISPSVTQEEVKALAKTMSLKYGAMNVRVGGAKAGIVLSSKNKKELIERFAEIMRPFSTMYFAGMDLGTTQSDIEYLYSLTLGDPFEFWKIHAERLCRNMPYNSYLSAKREMGDDFSNTITGYGVVKSLEEACRVTDYKLRDKTVFIQGFGSVGSSTALYLQKSGIKLVGVADVYGVIHNEMGLPISDLLRARREDGTIDRENLSGDFDEYKSDKWLDVDADILIPAAISHVIHEGNVSLVESDFVVEAANIPVTKEAEKILFDNGVVYIPDFIANAGLAAGYTLFMLGEVTSGREAFSEIEKRIRKATAHVIGKGIKERRNYREIAEEYARTNLRRMR